MGENGNSSIFAAFSKLCVSLFWLPRRAFNVLWDWVVCDNEDMKDEFESLHESLFTFHKSIDEFQQRIVKLEEDNRGLYEKLVLYETENDEKNNTVEKIRQELQDLKWNSRGNNLEIRGIPYNHGENIYTILKCIAQALDVPWNPSFISIAYRMPMTKSSSPPVIIATFVHRMIKDAWLTVARNKNLNAMDLSWKFTPGPVYINSHLTLHNKQLLRHAYRLLKNHKLASAWTVNGKVFVKKINEKHSFRVRQIEDLNQI